MATLEATGPNAEQIQYWNELAGPKWVAVHSLIEAQIRPLGLMAMDRAGIAAGERVLDVGCGCGNTTIEIAQRFGPTGRAVGIDVSAVMLGQARQLARDTGMDQVHFELADAQTHTFPPASFDAVYSRFGVMFFAHPDAAFANLCRAVRPGGRLAFVCWQALQNNPWMHVPLMAALQHIPPPAPPAPDAPGPFAFAEPERVHGILTRAGFAGVGFESVEQPLSIGGGSDLDQAVDLLLQMGPAAHALREAGAEATPAVRAAVREALAPFHTPRGVQMPSAAWIVTARRR